VSSGEDGRADTADDVASWTLARHVTDAVRGPHWAPKVATTRPTRPTTPTGLAGTTIKPTVTKPDTTKPTTTGVPGDTDGDGIPDNR
jgi:hypothetical protein